MEPRIVTNDFLIDTSVLFEQSRDAILIHNQQKFIDINPAGIELFGLKDYDEIFDGNTFKFIKDNKGKEYTLPQFLDQVYQHPDQKNTYQFITRFAFFWVEISCTLYKKNNQSFVFSIWRDITETRQLETYYQNNERKLNDALILANCATWEYDQLDHACVISKGLIDILGLGDQYKQNHQERYRIPIKEYKALIHPDDHGIFLRARNKIKKNQRQNYIDHTEYRVIRPDKEIRRLYVTTRISFEREGNKVKQYGTVQDITEIHQIEGELSKSKEQLSDALSVANLSTWELDIKSNEMKIGENFLEMLGSCLPVKDGNVVDVSDYISLIHPDDMYTYYLALDRAVKTRSKDYIDFVEYRILNAKKELCNIYVSIKVKKDINGNHLMHFGTIQDITHIKKTEAEKERFGKIIEATSDIVLIFDKEMKLIYLNQTAKDFYGFSPDDNIAGFPLKILQSDHSMGLMQAEILPTVADRGIWSGENVIQRFDKELITVSQVVVSHKGIDGEVEYFSSIIRDISMQKEIEQDLKYKNQELDTFVYKASHDLRGPITSLLGLHTVVSNEVKDKKSLEYFNLYNKQIIRLNDIILTLIQLTKIKELDITKKQIDFKDIIDSCINSFTNLPNFKFINFNIDLDIGHDFFSDKGLITTILQNLIENAIKYSKPSKNSEVDIVIKRNQKSDLIIKVQDHGIGIENELQAEVFNMFFRANNNVIGSGLGLYILKNAVDKLHGKVSLYSKVNEGTIFTIKLNDSSAIPV